MVNTLNGKNLMIDDWVQGPGGGYYQVTKIMGDNFACGFPCSWSYNNRFTPIPLSLGLMKKLGLKKVKDESLTEYMTLNNITLFDFKPGIFIYQGSFGSWGLKYYLSVDGVYKFSDHVECIDYLHELQHQYKIKEVPFPKLKL